MLSSFAFRHRWTPLFLIAFAAMWSNAGLAQDDDPSHRLLEAPYSDLTDVYQQMEMLRRLQQLANHATREQQTASPRPQPSSGTLDPEDLEKLRRLMQRAGAKIPPVPRDNSGFFSGDTSTGNPSTNHPVQSQLMKSLIERLTGQKSHIEPPTSPSENDKTAPPAVPQDPDAAPSSKQRGPLLSKRDRASNSPTQGRSRPEEDQAAITKRLQNMARRLGVPVDELLQSRNSETAPEEEGIRERFGRRTSPMPESNTPNSPRMVPGRPSPKSRPNVADNQTTDPETANTGSFGLDASIVPEDWKSDQATPQASLPPDWLEVLKELSEIERAPGTTDSNRVTSQQRRVPTTKEADVHTVVPHAEFSDATSLKELQHRFKDTFQQIMHQAKREAQAGDAPAKENGASLPAVDDLANLGTSISDSFAQFGGDMIKQAGQALSKSEPFESRSDSIPPANGLSQRSIQRNSREQTPWTPWTPWTESAGNWLSEITSVPQSVPSSKNEPPLAPASTSQMSLVLAISLAGLGLGFVFWFIHRQQPLRSHEQRSAAITSLSHSLRTRADIIRAFHLVAASSPAVQGDWWPHRRVAEAMSYAHPEKFDSMQTLANLYERARYLPPETELSDHELSSARRALQQCGVS